MHPHKYNRVSDPQFVTIYFMRGARADRKIALRLTRAVLTILLVVFCAVFLRVWQEMQIVKLGYHLNELRSQANGLLEAQHALMSRRNALAGLDRVEIIARTHLGMQAPEREQVIFLTEPAAASNGLGFWSSQGLLAKWLGGSERAKTEQVEQVDRN